MSTLNGLYLHRNPIANISSRAFSKMPFLETIHLESTSLVEMRPDMWEGAGSVQNLFLGDHQMITDLPDGAFRHLKNLRHLILGETGIRVLRHGIWEGLEALEKLNLIGKLF